MKPIPKIFRPVQVTLLVMTLLFGLTGCRSVQSDLGRMSGAPAEFTRVLLHDPAIVLKVRASAGAGHFSTPIANMLVGAKPEAAEWDPREVFGHIEALFTSVSSRGFVEQGRHSWLSVNTSLGREFIAGLDSELPFSSHAWTEAVHVRILVPTSGGAPNLDAASERWYAPKGPIEVVTHTRVLKHYVLVDALLVDAELEESRRVALMDQVQRSQGSLQTLRITPAFEGFLESQSTLAVYAQMDGLANLASMRKALALRKEALSDLPTLLSMRAWLKASRSLLMERDYLRHVDRRAEDFTLILEPGESDAPLRGQLLATPMGSRAKLDSEKRTSGQSLPAPAANPSIFDIEMAYDFPHELLRGTLPFWTLSWRGFDSFRAGKAAEESTFGPLVMANNPSLLMRVFHEDYRPLPIAFRMRAYPSDSLGDDTYLPKVAFAGRFIDDVLVEAYFEGLVRLYRERGESADFRFLREDDGYAVALYTRNMELHDAFPETAAQTPLSPFALQVDTEPTLQWFASGYVDGMGPLSRWLKIAPAVSHLSMSAATNDTMWALNFTLGDDLAASPPELKSHDFELAQHALDCRRSLLTQERYQRYSFLGGHFLPDNRHPRIDEFDSLAERLEQCDAGAAAKLNWLLAAGREEIFDFEGAVLGFSELCRDGHDPSCRAEERLGPLVGAMPDLLRFEWAPAQLPQGTCTSGAYVFIDDDELYLNGNRVGALGSEELARTLAQAFDEATLGDIAGIYRHYTAAMISARRQVAVFAGPDTDALRILTVLREVQRLDAAQTLRFVALARAPDDDLTCIPLEMLPSSQEHTAEATRIELKLSSRGFDLVEDGSPIEPILRCPLDSPTVCLRTMLLGLTPDRRVLHESLSPVLAQYDFDRLLRFFTEAREQHTAVTASVALGEMVSWSLFLKSVDVMLQPGTRLIWDKDDSFSRTNFQSNKLRIEVISP